ncbi:putative selenoprotein F/M [Helianthus annuus]|nr:putative selenoprotein F/M [Helianthus annuus]
MAVDTINRSLKIFNLISTILLLLFVCSKAEQLSSKECEDLGFTCLALCSDCNFLAEYVKDQDFRDVIGLIQLLSDCRKCCTEDSDDSTSKIIYSGAILEVCMRKLVFYPEVVSFIEDEKEKFPSAKVQYAFNASPKLIMLDDDAGQHKETIRCICCLVFIIVIKGARR